MSEFRPNVCVVLTGAEPGKVLVFRRVDVLAGPHRWQFPQGGLKPGETPEEGLWRELLEEIGTAEVEVLERTPEPLRYAYPPEVIADLKARGSRMGRYLGQEQHWFLARLAVGIDAIHFKNHPAEFDACEWVPPAEALRRVVPFKQEVYRRALSAFGLLPPEPSPASKGRNR